MNKSKFNKALSRGALTIYLAMASTLSSLADGVLTVAKKKHTSQVQGSKASLLLAQQKRERKNALRLLHSVE